MKVMVVLGASNDDEGNLLANAKSRCDKAFELFQNNPEYKILCTGGTGDHFNKTSRPHADYAIEYLKQKDIPVSTFLPIVRSGFTIEDAKLAQPILDQNGVQEIALITSDFHMRRALMIFKRIFPNKKLFEVIADTNVPEVELRGLLEHEEMAYSRDLKYLDKYFLN